MGKKVGLVTCYFKNNYGSMLQAYATKKFLDNNGIENETINIDYNKDFKVGKRKYYASQITNFKFIKNKMGMIKLKFQKKLNKELGKNIATRNKKYKEYRRVINLSRSSNDYNDLTNQAKELYTDVVVGSDQLWLPVNVVSDYYTLNWVPDDINKVSYATSFGFSSIPEKYDDLYKKFLNRINHLSTREESGVKIIEDITEKKAKLVCDPTILLAKEDWKKEIDEEPIYKEKYILCYFLGNNIEHRKFAERLKEKTGSKIVSLNHSDEYVKYSDTFCDYAPFDVGPKEWINLIENAEYVCTDSFHGTVFSILFNKKFFDFRRHNNKSKVSTNSRIDSLLDVAGISKDRILTGNEDIDKVLEYEIDYDKVNENIEKFRKDSQDWFLNSLTWKKDETKHINITVKEDCCGCTACYNICPVNAIEMCEDSEGFKYPKVDEEKCIKCGKCKLVCPIINTKQEQEHKIDGYVINNKNKEVRKESTSGGAFSAIAEYVIKNGGSVYGAAFDENFEVNHQEAKSIKDLSRFRNSKYVQSNLNDNFKKIKDKLENGKLVLFSGTPCQVEGLHSYLGKKYENLILVDVVCRAVPSPKLLRKYLDYIKKSKLKNENIEKVLFRDKSKYGYKYTLMTVKSKNYIYQEGIDTDQYLRAFFSGMAIRPACESCKFKKKYRVSDFTLWDCFNIEDFEKKFDDNIGSSRVLIQTDKGRKIFDEIKENIDYKKIDEDIIIRSSKELTNSTKANPKRKEFMKKLDDEEIDKLLSDYLPINLKTKIEKFGRTKLVNAKGYKKIKKFAKKILKR